MQTGRDDVDLNGNSHRPMTSDLTTASPTEIVPQQQQQQQRATPPAQPVVKGSSSTRSF